MKITVVLSNEDDARDDFEDKTSLLPYVIADKVIAEFVDGIRRLDTKAADKIHYKRYAISNVLVNRTTTLFKTNEKFRKQMLGRDPREQLAVWMRHWCTGELVKRYRALVDQLPNSMKGLRP